MFAIAFGIWVVFGVLIWDEAIKDDVVADELRMVTPAWRAMIGMVIVLVAPAVVIATAIVTLLLGPQETED